MAGRALTAGCRGCGARRASTVMEGGSPLEPALPGLRCPPWPVAPAPRAGEGPYASCTWRPSRGGAWLSACLAPQAVSLQPQVCVPRGGTAVRKPVWARLLQGVEEGRVEQLHRGRGTGGRRVAPLARRALEGGAGFSVVQRPSWAPFLRFLTHKRGPISVSIFVLNVIQGKPCVPAVRWACGHRQHGGGSQAGGEGSGLELA